MLDQEIENNEEGQRNFQIQLGRTDIRKLGKGLAVSSEDREPTTLTKFYVQHTTDPVLKNPRAMTQGLDVYVLLPRSYRPPSKILSLNKRTVTISEGGVHALTGARISFHVTQTEDIPPREKLEEWYGPEEEREKP